jgi:hypothetical protein
LLQDSERVWAGLEIEQRVAVIALMTVTIMPSPKADPQGGSPASYFQPEYKIEWKR